MPLQITPDLGSVFGVFLMRQAIEMIPNDASDAARVDGCSAGSCRRS